MSDTADRANVMFGREQTRGQMFAGLYLLLGGFVLGLGALGLFLFAGSREGAAMFNWREAALALGAVALTTFFLGLSIALPNPKGMRIASSIGVALCLVATALFTLHYPMHFNVQDSPDPTQADYTALDTILFALGLAIIIAGAFTSVVGYYVQRIGQWVERETYLDEDGKKTYEVPDWVVEQDIDDAMKRHGAEWGLGTDSTRLTITVKDEMEGAVIKGKGKARVTHLSAAETDKAVGQLAAMRPENRNRKQVGSNEVDDPVAALRAFRKQVAEDHRAFKVKGHKKGESR
jgi:hypothetical protein